MQADQFINSIRYRDFSFIKEISFPQALPGQPEIALLPGDNLLLVREQYNAALERLKQELLACSSKTESIIRIYQFNMEYKEELVQLLLGLCRSFKADDEVRDILKIARQFNQWSSTVLSEASLQGRENYISRRNRLVMNYTGSVALDHTPDFDQKLVKNGRLLELAPRFFPEVLDPKHRAWGTLFPPIRTALRPVFDGWVASDKSEDLTVAVAFDNDLRAKEELFDPQKQLDRSNLEMEHPAWFNSMNYYFTEREALDYLLISQQGLLLQQKTLKPLNVKEGRYLYVMDEKGNLFVSPVNSYREGKSISHTSFTRGESIVCAGELCIRQGKVIAIDNDNEHYQPGGYSLHRVVQELDKREVLAADCTIQVVRDRSFDSEHKGEGPAPHLSLGEFEQLYRQKMGNAIIPEIDLREPSNPAPLLHCLEKMNAYLTRRAGETSGFLSSLFKQYTSRDYSARRSNFINLAELLGNGDSEEAIRSLDEAIETFGKGYRTHYANLLKEMRDILSSDPNILSHEIVQRTVHMDLYMNHALQKHFEAHQNHADGDNGVVVEEAKIRYKFLRQDLPNELRIQFSKVDDVENVHRYNAYY